MTQLLTKIDEMPLEERALLALKAAFQRVVEEHAREGLPVYLWRDGKVVAVPAEKLLPRRSSTK